MKTPPVCLPQRRARRAWARCLLPLLGLAGATAWAGSAQTPWQLAGRLGDAQFIIVPESFARDRDYYDRVVEEACNKGESCFLRFFTNSRKLPVAMPLADEIYAEQTAMFSRSMKQLHEVFQFRCRLGLPGDCF